MVTPELPPRPAQVDRFELTGRPDAETAEFEVESGKGVYMRALARDLAKARGMAVLFTEHDMDVVFGVADRILVLNRGELIAQGSGEEIRAHPQVREVYLGSGATSGGH